ncbi:hypothetical protein BGZ83_008948 [Gryganskiella cystojenkinii]|nr:hypothetical protein BGZ83_008948 [Gryganskiella cystojenkinii]
MFRRALHPSLSAKTPLPWMDETEFHQVFRLWILYFHPRVQAPANIHFAQCLQIYVESRGAPSYCQPVSMDDATEALRRLEILWESYVHDSPLSEKVQKASRDALNENYEHRLREQERENARGNIVKIVQDVKVFEKALAATPKIASRPAVGVPVAAVVKGECRL